MCGLKTMWGSLLSLVICGGVFCCITLPVIFLKCSDSHSSVCDIFIYSVIALGSLLSFVVVVTILTGFTAFSANVIQFGIDQLQDSPARDCFLFIHWFLFTSYFGISLGNIAYSMVISTGYSFFFYYAFVLFLFLIAVPVSLCVAKRRWFITDSGVGNPYKDVARVVSFARKHKVPIRRSAFTYWEDDIPTGLDLGKSKYGGPFTTEQVENVKSFFGILYILLSLGSFFAVDIAASVFLLILKHHMTSTSTSFLYDVSFENILDSAFSTGDTLYPVIIVVLLPVYLKIIHPLLQRYGILKRIGIGLCLITINLICSLLIDSIGHLLPSGLNSTSVFQPQHFSFNQFKYVGLAPLNVSPQFLIIQQVLLAMAYILIYGGVFEFICAQSLHSMKGLLIGISFAVKGVFQLIGVLGILLPFSFWVSSPRAGLVYFSVNIVISVAGVVAFTVVAKRYQY
ncbi:solute carrier family 15 member 4-like [Halichondria panicea]|uniref:solute carrier family 15 member 4-like n=1 Tax=Halichondria panicea TaxID=6063 RepID=UPI00312B4A65